MMMRRWKLLTLFSAALLVAGVFLLALRDETANNPVLIADEAYCNGVYAAARRTQRLESFGHLLQNGSAVPYADGKYFLTYGGGADDLCDALSWSMDGVTARFMPDEAFADFAEALRTAHVFHLLVTDGNAYFTERVAITNLPVLSLTTDWELSYRTGGSDTAAQLFLSGTADGNTAPVESVSSFRVRGGSSSRYPKHPYRVTLYRGKKERNPLPLLGMRSSDEWVLLPLYTDPSHVREGVALELWNDIAATNAADVPGAQFRYLEMIVDGVYCGVYGLVTPVDEIGCGIAGDPDARLYKVIEYLPDEITESYQSNPAALAEIVELKYPGNSADEADFTPICDYIDVFMTGFATATAEQQLDRINLSNAIDHALFINFCAAEDNRFKNVYFLSRVEADGVRRMTKIPWDLNYTFGHGHDGAKALRTTFFPELISSIQPTPDVAALLALMPDKIGPLLNARWLELRRDVLSEEALLERFSAAMSTLTSGGAFARDAARWPDSESSADLAEITQFVHERLLFLDAYYAGLDVPKT